MGLQTPGLPSSQIPAGEDHVMRRLADIERFIRELTPSIARSIQPTVARLDAADVANAAQDAATAANVAAIAANVASINTLITQVVLPQSVNFAATNFAITTAGAVRASQTITVPAGYSQAVVSVISRVHAINPNTTGGFDGGGGDHLYSTAQIGAVAGNAHGSIVLGSNSSNINVDGLSTILPSLTSGGTFTLAVNVASEYATWAAQTANAAEMSGSILWLK
jgi:hypothetical protein